MPLYSFKNTETGEIKDILQSMNDEHVYFENGVEWQRVFHVPTAGIDTKIDPFSKEKFVKKTEGIKKFSDAWKISEEMSHARSERTGKKDEIRKKAEEKFYYKNKK